MASKTVTCDVCKKEMEAGSDSAYYFYDMDLCRDHYYEEKINDMKREKKRLEIEMETRYVIKLKELESKIYTLEMMRVNP